MRLPAVNVTQLARAAASKRAFLAQTEKRGLRFLAA